MNDKSKKFESFDDSFEDETATAEKKEEGDGSASGSNSGGEGKGKDEKGDSAGDGGSGDAGVKKDGDGSGTDGNGKSDKGDGAASGDGGDEGKGKEGEGEKGTEGKAGEKSAAEKAKTDDKSGDGKDTSGKDEGGDGAGEDGKEGKDEAKGADGSKGKEGEGEKGTDFFAADDEGKGKGSGEEGKTSYKPIAKEFGIELENDTQEELTKKVNEKIEASKQELNLADYSEQARSLITHLNKNKGDIGEFISNPTIGEMQGIINMEPEEKVRMVRVQEIQKDGKTEAEAVEAYNEELNSLTVTDIRKMSENIDTQAKKLRDEEITKIVGNKEDKLKSERETSDAKVIKERGKLKDHIQAQENFLGIELSPKARAQILSDLETGRFDDIVEKTPEASKFFAYMVSRYGPRIMESFSTKVTDANREGYNKASDKHTGALHNSKQDAKGKSEGGHQQGETGTKKNFDTFSDDLFSSPDEE